MIKGTCDFQTKDKDPLPIFPPCGTLLWSDGYACIKGCHLQKFFSADQTTTPSPLPSLHPFTATRWSYLQSVPFVLNTNPQYPLSSTYPHRFQTLYLWKGASQMSCAGAAAATATTPFFQKFNKGRGDFSPFFPFDRRLCALLCSNTPLIPPLLWVFEFRSRRGGWSFCLLIDGGSLSAPPLFNHLIRLLCNPQGPSCAWQQSHTTAGHYRQTPWTKPPNIHTKKKHNRSVLVQHYQDSLQKLVSLQQSSRAITMSGR